MRTIRASEIATYKFCERAWWYRVNGYPADNQRELVDGTNLHAQHGRRVFVSKSLRLAGYILLLLAIVILAVEVTLWLI